MSDGAAARKSSGGAGVEAAQVLEECLAGEVPEANAHLKLLHLYGANPQAVQNALSERANMLVANADSAPAAATRAGALLVTAARHLDENASQQKPTRSSAATPGNRVCRALLDHVLQLTGGPSRAAKDRAVRAQGCALVASLAFPGHKNAEAKLLEFALDRVPSIRERAVRGLAALCDSPAAEQGLVGRTMDPCTAVRASAVRALRVSASAVPALLTRLDDAEACVRAQLFHRLAEQPAALEHLGPAALARLLIGLTDRSGPVRMAAGLAVDGWRERLGSALALLERCNVMADEALGEAAAGALAVRYSKECMGVARFWLSAKDSHSTERSQGGMAKTASRVMLARMALVAVGEEDRDLAIDVPALMGRISAALDASKRSENERPWHSFILRQLLHIAALADVCDEGLRQRMERLAESIMLHAPFGCFNNHRNQGAAPVHTAIELAVVLLRKSHGLGSARQVGRAATQAQEARCSTQVIMLISDLCQPHDIDAGGHTTRLSQELEAREAVIQEKLALKSTLEAKKKRAVAEEEYIEAEKLKEANRRNDKELQKLQQESGTQREDRDGVCLRVLAILSGLLRWTGSELRRDNALRGALEQIVKPMLFLPALSLDVEVATVSAICLFCEHDGPMARRHWPLLLELLRTLSVQQGERDKALALLAAHALTDCAVLHSGQLGHLDRDEILSAASALSTVPFNARQVVIEPLCGWLLSLGHIFLEEHLREPIPEMQWGLGWMLVEAFAQHHTSLERQAAAEADKLSCSTGVSTVVNWGTESTDSEASVTSSRLTQFFALLPKLPGRHGAALLCLAVEAVVDSGLWRRAALQPITVQGQTRWLRSFSWPQLFGFAHDRLPPELRMRIWRCSLQACILNPALAALAEIPLALSAAAGDPPPGAPELFGETLRLLGDDEGAMAPLARVLPPTKACIGPAQLLLGSKEAEATEGQRRAALGEVVVDIEVWAPLDIAASTEAPPHHRMQAGRRAKRVAAAKPMRRGGAPVATPLRGLSAPAIMQGGDDGGKLSPLQGEEESRPDVKRRRKIDWATKLEDEEQVHLPICDAK